MEDLIQNLTTKLLSFIYTLGLEPVVKNLALKPASEKDLSALTKQLKNYLDSGIVLAHSPDNPLTPLMLYAYLNISDERLINELQKEPNYLAKSFKIRFSGYSFSSLFIEIDAFTLATFNTSHAVLEKFLQTGLYSNAAPLIAYFTHQVDLLEYFAHHKKTFLNRSERENLNLLHIACAQKDFPVIKLSFERSQDGKELNVSHIVFNAYETLRNSDNDYYVSIINTLLLNTSILHYTVKLTNSLEYCALFKLLELRNQSIAAQPLYADCIYNDFAELGINPVILQLQAKEQLIDLQPLQKKRVKIAKLRELTSFFLAREIENTEEIFMDERVYDNQALKSSINNWI